MWLPLLLFVDNDDNIEFISEVIFDPKELNTEQKWDIGEYLIKQHGYQGSPLGRKLPASLIALCKDFTDYDISLL